MGYTNENNQIKITKEVSEYISRKELREKKDTLKLHIDTLQAQLNELKKEFDEVKALLVKADELNITE